MRKITTFFIYLLIYTLGVSAQVKPTSVQGIPYDFSSLPTLTQGIPDTQVSTSDVFTFDDIKFWVGEGEKEAALVIDWQYADENALVWGYRWNGEAYGIDMFKAIAAEDPRLIFLTQETNLGYTIGGIGYDPLQTDFILSYDLKSARIDNRISFGFDIPNAMLNQTGCPVDPLQEITEAIEEGLSKGIIYHPLNCTNYGYACYDYDHWKCAIPDAKWRSAWYTGYWSYHIKDNVNESFGYSHVGASLRELINGSWDGWSFQDFQESGSMEGVALRQPFSAVLPLITLNERNITFEAGEQVQLISALHPGTLSAKTITWTSSNPEIASVDENGVVTGISIGTVIVSAEVVGEDIISGICIVNCVEVPVTEILLTPDYAKMTYGEELQLEVSFLPKNATNKNIRVWVSSDPSIAKVDENGSVKAVGSGTVTITAITEEGEKTATCQLDCIVLVTGISVSPQEAEMQPDKKLQLTVHILPENATDKAVSWISSNPQIATVDENGVVHAVAEGTSTISVISNDGEYIANSVITVKGTVGVTEYSSFSSNKVYPTITSESVTVTMEKPVFIRLTDVSGRTLLAIQPETSEISLSFESYPKGIYFIIIENQITKIIKN